jgi:hypothetical protein
MRLTLAMTMLAIAIGFATIARSSASGLRSASTLSRCKRDCTGRRQGAAIPAATPSGRRSPFSLLQTSRSPPGEAVDEQVGEHRDARLAGMWFHRRRQ